MLRNNTIFKDIFSSSLYKSEIPIQWKTCPIFKKGSKSNDSNYRPVALASVICRILESIIKNNINHFIQNNSLISKNQHGFIHHRSTTTQLLECLNTWTKKAENHLQTNVIYTDFAKAFDKVNHQK